MTDKQPGRRASAWLTTQQWAITPAALDQIIAIAGREHSPDFEAVLARQGERLARTGSVQLRGDVAVVPIVGPIFRYANFFTAISGATSIEDTALDFRAAVDDPRVRAIVLSIDSPGGSVAGISDFAKQVRAAATTKTVVAFVDGQAASAAFWIATAAPWLAISDSAIVGSVGVVAGIRVADDKDFVEIVSSQSPDKRPNLRTDEGRAVVQRTIDSLAQVFINAVADYRQVSAATVVKSFGAGGVKVGRDAIKANMADEISTLEDIISSFQQAGHGPAAASLLRLKVSGAEVERLPPRARENAWGGIVATANTRRRGEQ
jgi:capsid assembly protease